MLSTDVAQQVRQLLSAMETATLFQRLLELLEERQRFIDDQAGRMAGGNNLNDAAGQVHSAYVHTHQVLQGLGLRIVYKQIDKIAEAFSAYDGIPPGHEPAGLAGEIHSFAGLIDNFSTTHSANDAVEVLKQATSLRRRLEQSKVVLSVLLEKLEPVAKIPDGCESLTVVLSGEYGLPGVIDILQALQELCQRLEEIFHALNIEVTFSLRKLETGSISWELIAERVGITALKHLMTKGVDFWQRNYTAEGQLKFQVPLHANAIKEAVKLRNLLNREGIDVGRLDDAISEHAEFFVQRIGRITGSGHRVRVDSQSFDREPPSVKALQMERPAPRLENGSSKLDGEQS